MRDASICGGGAATRNPHLYREILAHLFVIPRALYIAILINQRLYSATASIIERLDFFKPLQSSLSLFLILGVISPLSWSLLLSLEISLVAYAPCYRPYKSTDKWVMKWGGGPRLVYSVYSFYCFVIHLHTNIFKIRLTKQSSGHIRCSLFALFLLRFKRTRFSILKLQISLAALPLLPSLPQSAPLKYYIRLRGVRIGICINLLHSLRK